MNRECYNDCGMQTSYLLILKQSMLNVSLMGKGKLFAGLNSSLCVRIIIISTPSGLEEVDFMLSLFV